MFLNLKKRYNHKRKENQGSNSKNCVPRKSTRGKISQRHEFIRIIRYFWRSYRGWENCIFHLKDYNYGWIFLTEFGEHFSAGFFSDVFFLRPRRKYIRKKPLRNFVNENSSKIRRSASLKERWKNRAKCR